MSMDDFDSGRYTHREELLLAEIDRRKAESKATFDAYTLLDAAVEIANRLVGVDFVEYARIVQVHMLERRIEVERRDAELRWIEDHKGDAALVLRVTGERV